MKTRQCKKTKNTQIKKYQTYDDHITFIILCDIPGYRMKSYGPSCLLPIGKIRLIDYQIGIIKDIFKNAEIFLCLGFESDNAIKYIYDNNNKHNIKIIENQLFEQYYSCESLRLALNAINNNKLFIIDGSLLINREMFKNISLDQNLIFSQKELDSFEISFNTNEKKSVEHMSYGASTIWIETVYMINEDIIKFKKLLCNGNFRNKFIFEAINELIKQQTEFKSHKIKNNIKKINNIKSYNEVRNKR